MGYTRKVVLQYLDDESELRGKQIGYKVFVNNGVLAAESNLTTMHRSSFLLKSPTTFICIPTFAATTT